MLKLKEITDWKQMIGQVVNGDCLKAMRLMPDNSVSLCLTDPPYGIGEADGKNKSRGCIAKSKDYGTDDWDNKPPSKEFFDEIFRVSKNQIIFGGNYFGEYLGATNCWIVWDKDNGDNDFADCELAWTSFSSAVRKFKWRWQGMLQEDMKYKDIRQHPTQKPVKLMQWCLEKYSQPNDLILDPFLGSGTTARACKDLGRRFIGIELEEKYCSVAEQRLQQSVLNLTHAN